MEYRRKTQLLFALAMLVNIVLGGWSLLFSQEPVTIEFWHVHAETFGGPAINELVERFNAQNPDIRVVEKFNPNMYLGLTQNLQAAIAAKNPPAITQLGNNWVEYGATNFPHVPIEEFLKNDSEGQAIVAKIPEGVLNIGRREGKLVAMIWSLSNPVLYYNVDMFKEAGLDPQNPPKTWKELREVARQIKEKTGNYGLYLQEPGDFWGQQALIESNGAELLKKDGGKWVTGLDSEEAIEAFELYADMALKDQTALHAPWDQGMNAFVGGKVGMAITTIARRNYVESNANFTVQAAPFPLFEGKPRRVPGGGNVLMITAQKKKEQEAAWRFIKYLLSPEAMTIWTKGTGYVPIRLDVAEDPNYLKPFLDANPMMRVALKQLNDVVPWVNFPGKNATQIEQILLDVRSAILTGQKAPREALKEAAAKINALLP